MNAIDLLRNQVHRAHEFLEATVDDLPSASIHYYPEGCVLPIGGYYGHSVIEEDGLLSMFIAGAPPLFASSWSGKTGFSSLPPEGEPLDKWARNLHVNISAARKYAQAVYARTDQLLASMSDQDLVKPLDMSPVGLGPQTVEYLFFLLLGNAFLHCGEICCVKGLQGLHGHPI